MRTQHIKGFNNNYDFFCQISRGRVFTFRWPIRLLVDRQQDYHHNNEWWEFKETEEWTLREVFLPHPGRDWGGREAEHFELYHLKDRGFWQGC